MIKTIEVLKSIGPLICHLSRALRRLRLNSKRSSEIPSPEVTMRLELLLQCGFYEIGTPWIDGSSGSIASRILRPLSS